MMVSGAAFAQQEAMYSQYMFNGLVLNPAYAGSHEGLSVAALYRNQWVGVEGAPVSQSLSVHAPLKKDNVALGLSIVNDRIGVTNTLSMNGIYAFRIEMESGVLSMGLQAGLARLQADYTKVALNPQGAPDVQFSEVQNYLMFNFGNGVYYYSDKFYAGVSSPNLFRTRLAGGDFRSKTTGEEEEGSLPQHARHFFLSTGYTFNLSEHVQVKPSTLIKVAQGAPVQFDINTNVWLNDFFGVGASYRSNNTLIGLAEVKVGKQFRVGYAYDHSVSDISQYTANTHEVMLRFDMLPRAKGEVPEKLY